eukprot:gene16682-24375_t
MAAGVAARRGAARTAAAARWCVGAMVARDSGEVAARGGAVRRDASVPRRRGSAARLWRQGKGGAAETAGRWRRAAAQYSAMQAAAGQRMQPLR